MSKRGAKSYDYDDDYDYEDDGYDDGYDEGHYEEEPAQSVQPSGNVTLDDDSLVKPLLAVLRGILDAGIADATMIAAIRAANYDGDAAMEALFVSAEQPEASSPAPVPAPEPVKVMATPPPRKEGGKAKKLSLAPSPAPSVTASPGKVSPVTEGEPAPAMSPGHSTAASPTSAHVAPFSALVTDGSAVVDAAGREALSMVVAGHVDTGKSTILGHLMVKMGAFAERDVSKFEQQCKRVGKQSFQYAWILDQSEEERRRGITIDSGFQYFDTATKRVTVADAPGHKDFVSNMISSAAQADLAVFIVSAHPGEFEVGLQHMTREHFNVLRTLGVGQVLVVVNKMDLVGYSEARFEECVAAVRALLQQLRFKEDGVIGFVPISGFHGVNLKPVEDEEEEPAGKAKKNALPPGPTVAEVMPWYTGKSLLGYIDSAKPVLRMMAYPLRFVSSDVNKQVVSGRIEAGSVSVGDTVAFVPSGVKVTVKAIDLRATAGAKTANAGDSVDITFNGDMSAVSAGNVACPPKLRCACATLFEAHVQFFPALTKAVLPGTKFLLQIQALNVVATVHQLVKKMDAKSGEWLKTRAVKCLAADTQGLVVLRTDFAIPLELAEHCRVMGRFILRQEGETVGGGLIKAIM
jgi:small GTP-binding protein